MPHISDAGRLTRIRNAFGQLQEKDEKLMLLQAKAFDRYGEAGEDTAVDLLTDHPELADSEEEFWQRLEAELEE